MINFTKHLPGLHRLMYGLLYPAVLGTIFVLFIGGNILNPIRPPKLLFTIVFLFHWSTEYISMTRPRRSQTYSLIDFISGIVLIIAMYLSFDSIQGNNQSYKSFYFWVFIIAFSFLLTDLVQWVFKKKLPEKRQFLVDLSLTIFALFFWVISLISNGFGKSDIAVTIFITSTLITSILTFIITYRKTVFVKGI